jgi:sirohydrochlorin cobaltochelatase
MPNPDTKEPAVVLAAFGASQPEALRGIDNVYQRVRETFPQLQVEVCFTSNQMRQVWQKRSQDPDWLQASPQIPEWVLGVKGPLAAIAGLQDAGFRTQIVQPLHIYAGEEYEDLKSYISGLKAIKTVKDKWMPFDKLALGRPALGEPGPRRPYLQNLERAAQALAEDAEEALDKGLALVYVGHGNHHFSTGVYHELQAVMSRTYPGLEVLIGTVEGMFGAEHVRDRLKDKGIGQVLMKPLMMVAGVHARDDIAGEEPDSWRSIMESAGIKVECRLEGLGEKDSWAGIFLEHIRDAAADAEIRL